jgi:protein ImuB
MLWLCILLPRFAPEASGGGPQAERAALEVLALWALQWSSRVSIAPAGSAGRDPALWIEIGASGRLFGGHAALRERIAADLASLGYTHRQGAALTPQGAALLARAGLATAATTRTQLRQQLAPLPLTLLALPDEQLAALQSAGLQCIGELLALPAAAIAQRFGPDASLYLQRLCGEAREPLRTVRPPLRFTSRCEFPDPVTDATALLFPLQRLLAGLQGYLRSLDRAVQRYTLCLKHHHRAATRLTIGLARPGRDAAQLLALARERLAAGTLSAPVLGLGIEAHELLQPLVLQSDLFSRAAQHTEQLQQVIDRLAARLGESAVQTLRSAADHRPERAWRMSAASIAAPATAPEAPAAPPAPVRPCWLLPEPLPIGRPQELLAGPERIESGWWDGADIARDYYLARGVDGAQLWVFHDLRNGAWCVHGLWA